MNRLSFFIVLIFLSLSLFAQQTTLSLNFELQNAYEHALLKNESVTFTSHRPFLYSDIQELINVDSIHYKWERDGEILSKLKHPKWWKKLRTEDLININKKGFVLKVNPLMDFSTGQSKYDIGSKRLMNNTRGVDIVGVFGKKLSFATGVYESQSVFPNYYSSIVGNRLAVPGQGRARVYKENGYDYSQAYGYVSFSPFKVFNFQLGHGKHFIGEGYRSLILSDNAYNMPYVKLSTKWKNVRYTNLLVAYQGTVLADGTGEITNRRYGSYTSLDFLIGRRIELGITESIVWEKKDSLAYLPNANLYNPFILYRTFQYGMDGVNNVLLGVNMKIKLSKSIVSYAQFVFDDQDKVSYQVGAKCYSIFKLPIFLQLEYNVAKPFTYTHWDKQSYTHYNQELAHPLGANFSEFVSKLRYMWKDLILSYQLNYSESKQDVNGVTYGSNLFEPYVGNDIVESEGNASLLNHSFSLAYLINPASNLQIYFEYRIRSYSSSFSTDEEAFWLFGLKTNLRNTYSDF